MGTFIVLVEDDLVVEPKPFSPEVVDVLFFFFVFFDFFASRKVCGKCSLLVYKLGDSELKPATTVNVEAK